MMKNNTSDTQKTIGFNMVFSYTPTFPLLSTGIIHVDRLDAPSIDCKTPHNSKLLRQPPIHKRHGFLVPIKYPWAIPNYLKYLHSVFAIGPHFMGHFCHHSPPTRLPQNHSKPSGTKS